MNIFDEAVKLLEKAEVENEITEVPEPKPIEVIKPKKVSVVKPKPLTKEQEAELERVRLVKAESFKQLSIRRRQERKTSEEIIVTSLEALRAEGIRLMEENKVKKEIRLKEKITLAGLDKKSKYSFKRIVNFLHKPI
jgi:hypothetical protein